MKNSRMLVWAGAVVGLGCQIAFGATNFNVVTWQYDTARTGWNKNETVLKPSNVKALSFGKLFSQPVTGYVFAQPLYLSNVTIPGKGVHNVVYMVTEGDKVYAFDADSAEGGNGQPLWVRDFTDAAAGITTVPIADVGLNDPPEIGITGTPVIDLSSGTIYVVAKTKEITANGPKHFLKLHAMSVQTGEEKPGSPVLLQASVPGTGDASVGGRVAFDARYQFNRPALLLQKGVVHIAFGTQGDITPSHGWVLSYDASTLAQVGAFCDSPNGTLGGIWMSGGGLSADDQGDIYGITGNGTFTANKGGSDYGDSFLRLRLGSAGFSVVDYFTPYNQDFLSSIDADLGSGNALILPDDVGSPTHPHVLIGCGKQGKIYLLDRDNLGKFRAGADTQIIQSFLGIYNGAWSCPAYFNHRVYFQGFNDNLRAFYINQARFNTNAISVSRNQVGYPGLTPGISANGTNDAIVWTIQADGYSDGTPAILRAYDAYDLTVELYNSSQAGDRDVAGPAMKFTTPLVANGKVYVPVGNGLEVYGLFSPLSILAQPEAEVSTTGSSVTMSVEASGTGVLAYQWKFNGGDIPGAVGSSLVLTNLLPGNAGVYTVLVSDETGSVLSAPVNLTVKSNLEVQLYAGLTVNGRVGESFFIQFTTSTVQQTWNTLTSITLTNTSQLWLDLETPASESQRYYRALPQR